MTVKRRSRKTRIIRFTFRGYHGRAQISLRVPAEAKAGDLVRVSPTVGRRVNRVCCPIFGCLCGERLAEEHPDGQWFITLPEDGEEVKGRNWQYTVPQEER